MLTIPVPNILDRSYPDTEEPYHIYVIRDADTILYIGKSVDPIQRLEEHFHMSWRSSGADIGMFYEQFQRYASDWSVDLYTPKECETVTSQDCCKTMDLAEVAMIKHFHPCLNCHYNSQPSPLPDKYHEMMYLADNAVDKIKW
jgi:hypothetical protein